MFDGYIVMTENQNFIIMVAKAFKDMINDPFIHVFAIAVLMDIFTGIIKGVFYKKAGSSSKGLLGMVKHLLVLLLVTTAYPYLIVLHFTGIAQTLVVFYIVVYGISIVENLGQMGVPVPNWLKKNLIKLKDDVDENTKKENEK